MAMFRLHQRMSRHREDKIEGAPASSYEGSMASLMHCAISKLGSAPSVSVVLSNDASGAIAYSESTRVINSATLLAW